MDTRHLRSFVTVAEELHFGRAADRLNLTQPPVTRHIQKLEERLGVRLLERNRRKTTLTPAGAIFLEKARLILPDLDRAVLAARQTQAGQDGQLDIGHSSAADLALLPLLVPFLRQRLPDVRLRLHSMGLRSLTEGLRTGLIELAFSRLPIDNDDFETVCLLRERLVAVLPVGHSLAKHKEVSIRDLAHLPIVLFPRRISPGYFDIIARFCDVEGQFRLNIEQESDSIQSTLGLVSRGLGVSIQPETVANSPMSGLALRPISESSHCVETGVAFLRNRKSELAARAVELLKGFEATAFTAGAIAGSGLVG